MRRAFTLMELMVVVGIMAFLGLAATNGYNALQRGIAERGAVDAASALLRAAKERAMVDRVPTAVFCYNRMLRKANDDENAVVVGEAVAIRRAGRITLTTRNYLVDEFGDFGNYDVVDEEAIEKRRGMRLWRFNDPKNSGKVNKDELGYAIVADAVLRIAPSQLSSFMPWADGVDGTSNHVIQVEALLCKDGGELKVGNFKVGDGYGFEFQKIRLPNGFLFGSGGGAVPSSEDKIVDVKRIAFVPKPGEGDPADQEVEVSVCKIVSGNAAFGHSAGKAKSHRDAER